MQDNTTKAGSMNRHMKLMLGIFITLFVLLGVYLFYSIMTYGEEWFASPFNPRISATHNIANAGTIYDRKGIPLAWSEGSTRHYASDPEMRRAVCHVVGDVYGKSVGAEAYFARYLYGYDQGVLDKFTTALSGDERGGDVYLTIDADLCKYIYEHMEYNGAVVVMNYKTGEILGEVSTPTFNPEDIPNTEEEEGSSQYLNRATQGRYPPGSTMKIVTTKAALQAGITGTVVDCTGEAIVAGQRVTCRTHGEEDLQSAFEDSCNIYFADLAVEMGAEPMRVAADECMFNYDWHLPDFSMLESSFQTGSNDGDLAWAGIGQYHDLITPMHNMLISAAIGNGGTMMQPNTLLDVRYGNRSAYTYSPTQLRTIMNTSQANTLATLMRATVQEGTGTSAAIDAAAVSGKTGTAEYSENGEVKNHSWFVGFVQDDAHPLAIAVILEGAGFGSAHAAPLAGRVLDQAIALGY